MRRFFTHRKTLALVIALLTLGVVWLATRAPREPVYKGKKLSWWFSEVSQNRADRLTREQLQSLGPGGVEWLAYQAAQGGFGDYEPSKLARTQRLILRRIRSLRSSELDIRAIVGLEETLFALQTLGPEAVLAATPDDQTRVRILHALVMSGFPSDPEWVKQLEAFTTSPDPAVVTLAQAALAHRQNPWGGAISPSKPAGFAAPAKTP